MLSAFGKEMRKLRVDEGERLLDMGERLNRSPAFLSAVETGKKSPPVGFEDEIADVYSLSNERRASLKKAGDRSRAIYTIKPKDELAREATAAFARRVNDLSRERLRAILGDLED